MKCHRRTGSLPQDPIKHTDGQTCSSDPLKKSLPNSPNSSFQVQP